MYPPLAFITSLIRSGIVSISLMQTSNSIPFQTSWSCSQRSSLLVIWPGRFCRRLSTSFQTCSIGLRSGDCEGHSKRLMWFLSNHCLVSIAVCFGSLSCWNIMSDESILYQSRVARNSSSKIFRYSSPSNLHRSDKGNQPLWMWRIPIPWDSPLRAWQWA